MFKKTNFFAGRNAERFVAVFLRFCFYKIIAARYKTRLGEIDLIAVRGSTLVFVEVKYRPTIDEALLALQDRQKKRIARTAMLFLAQHPFYNDYNVRFDLVAVAPKHFPRHIKNVIEE